MSSVYRDSSASFSGQRMEKRVSFEDLSDPNQNTYVRADPLQHTIQIKELFPEKNKYRSILRRSLPEIRQAKHATKKTRSDKKRTLKIDDDSPRRPFRLPPFKKPTEPLAHALLRSMSYREPSKRTRLPRVELLVKSDSETNDNMTSPRHASKVKKRNSPTSMLSNKTASTSSKSRYSAPETLTFNSNVFDIVIKCGPCLKRKRTSPASGFCRFCDEYLCASCIYQHRGLLTRSHPVMVFNCDTCKEMNVLNKRDSGFCVKCKKYFCPICVISHCSVTNHDVLEGHDMLDVVYATIHRGFL